MPRYRKKPLEVIAVQFTGNNLGELWEVFGPGGLFGLTTSGGEAYLAVTTTHGDAAFVRRGDYVVPDSKPGTYYPIKPDVFEATYDPIEE